MQVLRWRKIAGRAAFHAARDAKTRTRPLPYHGHDFAEIFWIDAGRGTHRINGVSVELQPGSLVMMRPSDCHGIQPQGLSEIKLTNVAFPAETLAALQSRYFSPRDWPFAATRKLPVMGQLQPAQQNRFNQWADALSQSPRERLFIDRFLLNVLADLREDESQASTPTDIPYWLAQACRAIQERDQFAGGVERFLKLCGRSREHVARTVQQTFHVTPTEYVNRLRIAHACRQLEMSDQSILEIALDCGIGNLSHFYSLFRARTGMTPRGYRLGHRRVV
jgi:AraC family cel operon transcriptional repressor